VDGGPEPRRKKKRARGGKKPVVERHPRRRGEKKGKEQGGGKGKGKTVDESLSYSLDLWGGGEKKKGRNFDGRGTPTTLTSRERRKKKEGGRKGGEACPPPPRGRDNFDEKGRKIAPRSPHLWCGCRGEGEEKKF